MRNTLNDTDHVWHFSGTIEKLMQDGTQALSSFVAPGEALITDSGRSEVRAPANS